MAHTHNEAKAWIVIWALAAILQIVSGARLHDPLLAGFGVTALAINIYTRYYEQFWDRMHADLFFLLGGYALFAAGLSCEVLLRRRQTKAV